MPDSTNTGALEIYRKIMLPLMGIAETIGTRGRSPGTVARQNVEIFDRADAERRAQEMADKKAAMESELFGMKKTEHEDTRALNQKLMAMLEAQGYDTLPVESATISGRGPVVHRAVPKTEKAPKPSPDVFTGDISLDKYVERVYNGEEDPNMSNLSARGVAGAQAKLLARQLLKEKHPDFDVEAEKAAYRYFTDVVNQRQRQVINTVQHQLPNLVSAAKALKMSGLPYFDRKTLDARRAAGDVNAARYLSAFTVSVEDVAKGTAGGLSLTDDQLALANELIYRGGTFEQVKALADEIKKATNARKASMYIQGGLQGRRAAQKDPYLPNDLKQRIVSGEFEIRPEENPTPGGYSHLPTFTSEAEVEQSAKEGKIQAGDSIIINGRKAIWE